MTQVRGPVLHHSFHEEFKANQILILGIVPKRVTSLRGSSSASLLSGYTASFEETV